MKKSRIKYFFSHPFLSVRRLMKYLIQKQKFKRIYISDDIRHQLIITPHFITLGKHVTILNGGRIEGVSTYNQSHYNPNIIFHDRVTIQQYCHITCANKIEVGANTAIAAFVTITDIHHPYNDINVPIESQNLKVSPVLIGEDCKIYNGAVILPGVTIGKHVTIGANSVVTHDIPEYSVAVGSPAKIVKKYDFDKNEWINLKYV